MRDFLSGVVARHGTRMGLSEFRAAMCDDASLNALLQDLADLHGKLYSKYAGQGGVNLQSFLRLAEAAAPTVLRPRATSVFVQSMPVEAVYLADHAKVLDPSALQEALLRLGFLVEDAKTQAGRALMGAELSTSLTRMSPARLPCGRRSKGWSRPRPPRASAPSRKRTAAVIQACTRAAERRTRRRSPSRRRSMAGGRRAIAEMYR